MLALIDAFDSAYMQRALVEVLLLAVPAGLLGSWIVLRRLAFFAHAAGTAAFPGLVVAGPWGIAPQVTALGAGLLAAGGVERAGRLRRIGPDAATGLVLVAALAAGVVLASDVYESGAEVDRLLFGSLLALESADLWTTAGVAAGVVALDATRRRRWLADAFDGAEGGDRLLVAAIALTAIVALDAVGALLVSALLVVPAATARLLTTTVRSLRLTACALAAAEGVAALVVAREIDAGPGAVLAVLGGAVFALVAVVRR